MPQSVQARTNGKENTSIQQPVAPKKSVTAQKKATHPAVTKKITPATSIAPIKKKLDEPKAAIKPQEKVIPKPETKATAKPEEKKLITPTIAPVPEKKEPTTPAQPVAQVAEQKINTIPENALISHDYREVEELRRAAQLQKELIKNWNAPIGISKDCTCTICVTVTPNGTIKDLKTIKASGILMYDISARQALFAMTMPQWTHGKTITITFKQ